MTRRFHIISKPLIVLIFLICFTKVYSQNITWYKVYNGPDNWDDAGNAICKADGDNFFIAATATSHGYLMKINQYGDTLFTKRIGQLVGSGQTIYSIVPDGNNNFYLTGDGSRAFVIKININGDVLWEKYYTPVNNYVRMNESKLFSDNCLVSCGKKGTSQGYIQKIDSAGNLLWSKIVDGGFSRTYCGLEEDSSGNVVVAGFDFATSHFSKYSSTGAFIYEKNIGTIMPIKMRKASNGYNIGGYNFQFLRLDTAGNFLSRHEFNDTSQYEQLYDLQMINENKFVMCCFSYNKVSDTVRVKIVIADTSGKVLHSKILSNISNYIKLKGIHVTPGGDILFTGFREIENTTMEDIIIMRTNQYLEGPTSGINSNQISSVNSFQLFQNYPNPFNPSTTIQFSIPKNGIVAFKVYDSIGKEVYFNSKYFNAGSHQMEYSAENLSSGIYFYSLQFGEIVKSKKMIFVK